jgi:hypothetical protein
MSNSQCWEFVLTQLVEKEHEKIPDFLGETQIGSTLYNIAAWFREIGKGANTGRPCLGLQLTSKDNANQKVSITLWEKANRKTNEEPHFKVREELNGQDLQFSAWVEPAGQLFVLRIRIEPFTVSACDLSEAARETHQRLTSFLEETKLRLPAGQSSKEQPVRKTVKLGPDEEPDDIPY